ncbi:hypothetical protein AAZX31_02G105800 [Glycine max]
MFCNRKLFLPCHLKSSLIFIPLLWYDYSEGSYPSKRPNPYAFSDPTFSRKHQTPQLGCNVKIHNGEHVNLIELG